MNKYIDNIMIKKFKRVRIPEDRNLERGIRMNRNERVEDFKKNILKKIFSQVKKYELGKYPDQSIIYNELSKFLRIRKENLLLSSGIDEICFSQTSDSFVG